MPLIELHEAAYTVPGIHLDFPRTFIALSNHIIYSLIYLLFTHLYIYYLSSSLVSLLNETVTVLAVAGSPAFAGPPVCSTG